MVPPMVQKEREDVEEGVEKKKMILRKEMNGFSRRCRLLVCMKNPADVGVYTVIRLWGLAVDSVGRYHIS